MFTGSHAFCMLCLECFINVQVAICIFISKKLAIRSNINNQDSLSGPTEQVQLIWFWPDQSSHPQAF